MDKRDFDKKTIIQRENALCERELRVKIARNNWNRAENDLFGLTFSSAREDSGLAKVAYLVILRMSVCYVRFLAFIFTLLSYRIYRISLHFDKQAMAKSKKADTRPSTIFAEIVLPRKDAETVIDGLETLYERRFVPRYGTKKAKWLFHIEVIKAAFSVRLAGMRKFFLKWRKKPTQT